MITELTYECMIGRIGPLLDEWNDSVIPSQVELLASNQYSPRYAWMFSYEKRLKSRIEGVLARDLAAWECRLFGADGALSEGLSNAFVHAHRRDPARPIEVRCAVAQKGLAFSIQDQGSGFDVPRAVAQLKHSGRYYHLAGNGLRSLAESPHIVTSFASRGRVLNLLCEFR